MQFTVVDGKYIAYHDEGQHVRHIPLPEGLDLGFMPEISYNEHTQKFVVNGLELN